MQIGGVFLTGVKTDAEEVPQLSSTCILVTEMAVASS